MSHDLRVVIGKGARFPEQVRRTPQAQCAPLPQDCWAVPITDELHDAVAGGSGDIPAAQNNTPPGFAFLAGMLAWVTTLSETGPVVYFETEFFGGVGYQAAAVIDAGSLPRFWTLPDGTMLARTAESMVLIKDGSDWRTWSNLPAYRTPVSEALAAIGVAAQDPRHHLDDEFEAVRLGTYRDNDALVDAAQRTLS